MKTNKLAAGALALALGLGAVTPAFAATTATENSGKGEVIVTAEYRQAETEYVEAFKALQEAEKTLGELEAIKDAKYEVYLQALEAIDNYHDKIAEFNELSKMNRNEARVILLKFRSSGGTSSIGGKKLAEVVDEDLTVHRKGEDITEEKVNNQVNSKDNYLAHVEKAKKINADIAAFEKGGEVLRDLENKANKASEEHSQALREYEKQEDVRDAAKGTYDKEREEFIKVGGEREAIGRAEKYGDVTYVTDFTPSEDDDKDADADAKEAIEAAEEALYNARVTRASAEFLLDKTPETVKSIKDELVKLLAEQEEKIEALNKALDAVKGKSVALSDILFSTAYAAEGEEEDPLEPLKKATDDLNENTDAMNELMEGNEANLKEANENADPEPSDDDNEPSDDDNEPADEMNSDENEEKPAEKTETKTEVKTVKKPAKNAKTGVVGVAGVAGVLAAASVAYAASKKNN